MSLELGIALVGGAIYAAWRIRGERRAKRQKAAAQDLGQTLRRRRTPAPEAPKPTEVPESDAESMRLDAGATPPAVPAHNLALIEYIDAEGQRSRRRITVQRIAWTGPDDGYLFSYCHERQAVRSFILSRVQSVTDMQTGEVFTTPVEYFRGIAPQESGSPLDQLFRAMDPEIVVLIYLARSDARMVADERAAITEFLLASQPGTTATAPQIDERLKRTRCEDDEFVDALISLGQRPETRRRALLDAARRVVDADGRSNPGEVKTVEHLQAALGL